MGNRLPKDQRVARVVVEVVPAERLEVLPEVVEVEVRLEVLVEEEA